MVLIKQVVQKALASGYLTHHAEAQLRRLFDASCDLEDIEALNQLQQAVGCGQIKRLTATPHSQQGSQSSPTADLEIPLPEAMPAQPAPRF